MAFSREKKQWLNDIPYGLSASQFGMALGLKGRVADYVHYRREVAQTCFAFTGNESTTHGIRTEPLARACYSYLTKSAVTDPGFSTTSDRVLGCTPDGRCLSSDHEVRILEIKSPIYGLYNALSRANQPFGIPVVYLYQMQGQMAITGSNTCDFFVFWHPGHLSNKSVVRCEVLAYRVHFSPQFWSWAEPKLRLVSKWIQDGLPPSVDRSFQFPLFPNLSSIRVEPLIPPLAIFPFVKIGSLSCSGISFNDSLLPQPHAKEFDHDAINDISQFSSVFSHIPEKFPVFTNYPLTQNLSIVNSFIAKQLFAPATYSHDSLDKPIIGFFMVDNTLFEEYTSSEFPNQINHDIQTIAGIHWELDMDAWYCSHEKDRVIFKAVEWIERSVIGDLESNGKEPCDETLVLADSICSRKDLPGPLYIPVFHQDLLSKFSALSTRNLKQNVVPSFPRFKSSLSLPNLFPEKFSAHRFVMRWCPQNIFYQLVMNSGSIEGIYIIPKKIGIAERSLERWEYRGISYKSLLQSWCMINPAAFRRQHHMISPRNVPIEKEEGEKYACIPTRNAVSSDVSSNQNHLNDIRTSSGSAKCSAIGCRLWNKLIARLPDSHLPQENFLVWCLSEAEIIPHLSRLASEEDPQGSLECFLNNIVTLFPSRSLEQPILEWLNCRNCTDDNVRTQSQTSDFKQLCFLIVEGGWSDITNGIRIAMGNSTYWHETLFSLD